MLSQEELKQLINYDPDTGLMTWKKKTSKYSKINIGDKISTKDKFGYIVVRINYKRYKAHRLVFVFMNGTIDDKLDVDHVNGNKSDNRWSNLRLTDNRGNSQNRPEHRKGLLAGASYREKCKNNPWLSQIQINKKKISLGYYKTQVEAHEAYLKKCEEIKLTSTQ